MRPAVGNKTDAHVRKYAHGRAGVTVKDVTGNFAATKEWGQASFLCCRSLAVNFHATVFKGDTHAVAFYNPFSLQTLHKYTWLHNNLHSCTGTGQQTKYRECMYSNTYVSVLFVQYILR